MHFFHKGEQAEGANPLWTRDFTIITIGSVISMLGNALSGFAMSLMVLDYSGSTFLYALYIAVFTLPQIIMPVFSGAILDRFSRKKTIYTLDFISAGLYALMAAILFTGWFSFPVFAVYCFMLGAIQSIYLVAYESFYPLLISEGNYSKAYSIAGLLETMSALMIPVSTWLYDQIGLAPLLAVNAVCFFIAASIETQIRAGEDYIQLQQQNAAGDQLTHAQRMFKDIREGLRYLAGEKGLLAVTIYFTFSFLAEGVSSVITLPYFNKTFENGRYVYIMVWGMSVLGRGLGSIFHYRVKLPARWRYTAAFGVYLMINILEGIYLFTPVPVMMAMCLMVGLGGITSYTIRISATQSYVPDEKKGRYNGAFSMLNTAGMLVGEILGGALTVVFPERGVLAGFMILCTAAAVIFIGGNKKEVSKLYNRVQ